MPDRLSDNARGACWMLLSVAAASAMTVGVRDLSTSMDTRMIVTARAIGALALTIAALAAFRAWRRARVTAPARHLARGALIGASTHLGFLTIANLPLATATVLFFTAPIFATLLAIPIQGERIGPRRAAAVAAGFVGALVILRPGFGEFHWAMGVALASSALFSLALVLGRGLAGRDGPVSTYLSSVVITLILSVPLAAPVWGWPSGAGPWAAMALVVVGSMLRGIGDIQAFRYGEASFVAPFSYLRLVLIGVAGYVAFGETPDTATLLGGAIIVAATLYIAIRERARGASPKAGAAA